MTKFLSYKRSYSGSQVEGTGMLCPIIPSVRRVVTNDSERCTVCVPRTQEYLWSTAFVHFGDSPDY